MGVDRGAARCGIAAPIMDIDYYFLTAAVFPKLNYIFHVATLISAQQSDNDYFFMVKTMSYSELTRVMIL